MRRQVIAIIRVNNVDGLDQKGSSRESEKWSILEAILKVELTESVDG